MQRVQIGSPQLEQVRRVSTCGWFTQAGTTCADSVAIATQCYEESVVTARPSLRALRKPRADEPTHTMRPLSCFGRTPGEADAQPSLDPLGEPCTEGRRGGGME